jgi:hypothetical protein
MRGEQMLSQLAQMKVNMQKCFGQRGEKTREDESHEIERQDLLKYL